MELQDFIFRSPTKIINNIRPGGKWYCKGGVDYDNLVWVDDEISKPTREEYEAEFDRLVEEFKSLEYQRQRKPEYPSITDQLDTLYHQGYDRWKAMIDEVKNKYPKPGGD